MRRTELIPILDEQAAVGFTGKVNILRFKDSGLAGSIELVEGEVTNARFGGSTGLKAFFNACVSSFEEKEDFSYVVEPEIIQGPRKIPYPYSVLRRKMIGAVELYKKNRHLKPPESLKLLITPEFIAEGESVTGEEFELLRAISDYNLVKEIYKNCDLPDYQITNALVSLRKKKAITVVKKDRI